MERIPCTVLILTSNAAKTLNACLSSVETFAEVLVLDGNSKDTTKDIVRTFGRRFANQNLSDIDPNQVIDFSKIRNEGTQMAHYDWILNLDSDEIISEELISEIRQVLQEGNTTTWIYKILRKYIINDKIIHFASTYPILHTRFYNRACGCQYRGSVHERLTFDQDLSVKTLHGCVYSPLPSPDVLLRKWQGYLLIEQEHWRQTSVVTFLRQSVFPSLTSCITVPAKIFLARAGKKEGVIPIVYELMRYRFHLLRLKNLMKKMTRHFVP